MRNEANWSRNDARSSGAINWTSWMVSVRLDVSLFSKKLEREQDFISSTVIPLERSFELSNSRRRVFSGEREKERANGILLELMSLVAASLVASIKLHQTDTISVSSTRGGIWIGCASSYLPWSHSRDRRVQPVTVRMAMGMAGRMAGRMADYFKTEIYCVRWCECAHRNPLKSSCSLQSEWLCGILCMKVILQLYFSIE